MSILTAENILPNGETPGGEAFGQSAGGLEIVESVAS
jgi:hypothetical protein